MTAADLVQRQLDACNAREHQGFAACFSSEVQLYRPPAAEAAVTGRSALAACYADNRFKR